MRVQGEDFTGEIPIVKGPGATRLFEVMVVLLDKVNDLDNSPRHNDTRVIFTLKLPGSDKIVEVPIGLTTFSRALSMNPLYHYFEGVGGPHGDAPVSGYYSLSEPSGSSIRDLG
jgi:hypothetical protein